MLSRPQALFFDLDETLIKNRREVPELFQDIYTGFEEELGLENKPAFFSALRVHARGLWESMFLSDETPEQQFARCFANAIAELDLVSAGQADELGERMLDHYLTLSSTNVELHHDALSTLRDLRAHGLTVGIITNGIEAIQRGKIRALALEEEVDHVTISAEARAHKPHRPVFDLSLKRAGVSADKAWQIGDHATNDVAGAIRAGMSGIFYDPTGERRHHAFNELDEDPHHTVSALSEVLELLELPAAPS